MESNSDNPKLPEMYRVLLKKLLTAEAVAEWSNISRKTVYAYAERGDIPCVRVNMGRSIRFIEWELLECLATWREGRKYRPRRRPGTENS